MPKKTLAAIAIVLAGLVASAVPAQAKGPNRENIVGVVVGASGAPGTFDDNPWDYDILRDAVITAGLADALSGPGPFTVFAPNDFAFMRTAADLGIRGSEAEVLAGLAAALGDKLDDVLLYHVDRGAPAGAERHSRR
ncbi:MAG TPA: fasciclin domain-containing protein [Acidimicrobiales bacterium]|nr:fasciclin domain-containing protein [Acidimicrobiales bacterium]